MTSLTAFLATLLLAAIVVLFTDAAVLGEKELLTNDPSLNEISNTDVLFRMRDAPDTSAYHHQGLIKFEIDFERIVKKQVVEIVSPGAELLKVMNTISTRSRVMFLKDYDKYFQEMRIGTTSRPMLMSFLSINLASKSQIDNWYKPYKSRFHAKIVSSCNSLIEQRRAASTSLSNTELASIGDLKWKLAFDNEFYLAHLVFKNNLNLFMLENFIQLCMKLDDGRLSKIPAKLMVSF